MIPDCPLEYITLIMYLSENHISCNRKTFIFPLRQPILYFPQNDITVFLSDHSGTKRIIVKKTQIHIVLIAFAHERRTGTYIIKRNDCFYIVNRYPHCHPILFFDDNVFSIQCKIYIRCCYIKSIQQFLHCNSSFNISDT